MLDVHRTTLGDLERIARERGQKGTVAIGGANGGAVANWQQSSRVGRTLGGRPNKALLEHENRLAERLIAQLHEGLPPVVRRTPRQRYDVLLRQLIEEGLRTYRVHGYPVWPKSIQQELKVLGWKDGDPDFYGQAEALANQFIVKWANTQREKDQRKTALDWHGGYNA